MSGWGRWGDGTRGTRRARPFAVGMVMTVLAACTGPSTAPPTEPPSPTPAVPTVEPPELRLPPDATTVVGDPDPAALAVAASAALYASSPAVVVAPTDDLAAQVLGASAAVALGVPLLLAGTAPDAPPGPAPSDGPPPGAAGDSPSGSTAGSTEVPGTRPGSGSVVPSTSATPAEPRPHPWADEAGRLGAEVALAVGVDVAAPGIRVVEADEDALKDLLEVPVAGETDAADPAAAVLAVAALPGAAPSAFAAPATPAAPAAPAAPAPSATRATPEAPDDAARATLALLPGLRPDPVGGGLVLSDGAPATLAPVATARAAGQPVVLVPGGDPRVSAPLVDAVAAAADPDATVVAFGAAFGSAERLDPLVRTAATGVQLPGGGQRVLPGRRVVALYGSPGYPELGVLGEQDPAAAVVRAQQQAAQYQELTTDPVVPAFELIATIADAEAGPDGDYSRELSVAELTPWVDAAEAAGLMVVLDLQPGRTDFLTQARRYEELLARPNVGLALDPEWRLAPDQVHLRQIGSVGVDEVNAVAGWLADLTRSRRLPQKLLVLHQFAPRMITGRERLDLSRPELAVVLHVDGQGTQPGKAGTWATLRRDAPAGLWWGWKNFLDEDLPVLTPEQTLQVQPVPDLITYQ